MEKLWDFLNKKSASTHPVVVSELKFSMAQGRCCLTRRTDGYGEYTLIGVCTYQQRIYQVSDILSCNEYDLAQAREWRLDTVKEFLEMKFAFLEMHRLAVIDTLARIETSWMFDVTAESYFTVYYRSSQGAIERSSFDCIRRELTLLIEPDVTFSEEMKKYGVRVLYGQEGTIPRSLPNLLQRHADYD